MDDNDNVDAPKVVIDKKDENDDNQKLKDMRSTEEKNEIFQETNSKSRSCNKNGNKYKSRKSRSHSKSKSSSRRRSRSKERKDRKRSTTPEYRRKRSRSRERRRSRDRRSRSRDRQRRSRSIRKRYRSKSRDRKADEAVNSNERTVNGNKSPTRRNHRHSNYKSDRRHRRSNSRDIERRPSDGDRRYRGSPKYESNYDRSNNYGEIRRNEYSSSQRNNYHRDRNYSRRFNDDQFEKSDVINDDISTRKRDEPLFGIDLSEQSKLSDKEDIYNNSSTIPVLLSSLDNLNKKNPQHSMESQPSNFVRPVIMSANDIRFPPPRLATSQPNLVNFKELLPNMREPPPNFLAFRADSNFQVGMNNNNFQTLQPTTQQSQIIRPPLPVLNQGPINLRNFEPNQVIRPMQMLQGPGARIEIPIDLRFLSPELRLSMFNTNSANRPTMIQQNQLANIFRGFQVDPTRMMQQSAAQPQQQQSTQHLLAPPQRFLSDVRLLSASSQQQHQPADVPPPPPPLSSLINNRPTLVQHHLPFNVINNVSNKTSDGSSTTNAAFHPSQDRHVLQNQIPTSDFNVKPEGNLLPRAPIITHRFPPPPPPPAPSSLSQPSSTTNSLDSLGSQNLSSTANDEKLITAIKSNVKQKTATSSELYSPNSCASDSSSVDAYTEALFEEPFVDNGTPLEEESDSSLNVSQSVDVPHNDNLTLSNLKSNNENIASNGILKFKDDESLINKTISNNKVQDRVSNMDKNTIDNETEQNKSMFKSLVQKNLDLTGTLNLFHVNDLKKVLETANSASKKSTHDIENKTLNPAKNACSGMGAAKLSKTQKMEQIADEVKAALRPHFFKKLISKDDYKDIMRRAVPKIFNSKSTLDSTRIQSFIQEYVNKITRSRKSGKMKNTTAHGASHDKKHAIVKINP
ncbi:hypothetical protein HELRODRAFT_167830 [Helobdella robusta]|uniref:SFR19-like C-terminal domain-containing protein n=1 Tax=Helobdella robusta TaxID=6412 RepID=T1EZU7_HELRO|nr:hypothetical protein HELRODRAFT_167830 [Helobdella robusta]ESO09995.1 hypothetical protein HELRODRAFT_167830 [Helobdella robusta]